MAQKVPFSYLSGKHSDIDGDACKGEHAEPPANGILVLAADAKQVGVGPRFVHTDAVKSCHNLIVLFI